MTNTDGDTKILKTEALGRVRTPAARREQLLDEFEQSGVSGVKFGQLTGLKYQTLATWLQARRKSTVARPRRATNAPRAAAGRGAAGDFLHQANPTGGGVVAGLGKARPLMLSFAGSLKGFVALEACGMRKGFKGLHALVTEKLAEDPPRGARFVFTNRRRSRLKILGWDGTGLWVCTKRLEQGAFSWPRSAEPQTTKLRLAPEARALLTDGVDLRGPKLRPWYERDGA